MSTNDSVLPAQPQAVPAELGMEQLATGAAADAPEGRGVKLPRHLRSLFALAPLTAVSSAVALSASTYFPAIQVEGWDPENKAALLALITTVSAIGAMLTQPIIGVLSDRTRGRFGARKPWMFAGIALVVVALLTAGLAPGVAALTIGILLLQIGYGFWGAPFATLLPDRVPERFRGRYSTFIGLGSIFGAVVGPVVGSLFVSQIFAGYLTFAGIAAVASLLLLLVIPSNANRDEPREPFSARAFFTAFWVNPRKHPDFAWGFTNRLLIFGALAIPNAYSIYILQDYVGMSIQEAAALAPLLGLTTLPVILIVTSFIGPLTDRIGRRKPTVLLSGLLIAAGAVIPAVSPTVPALFLSTAITAAASGMYIVTDVALMSLILPNKESYGKDLGILNIAVTLPNVIAPALAGMIVTVSGGYFWLYPVMAAVGLVGAFCVIPIKSTR